MNYFNKKINKIKNRKGFTLIELIIVIAIIGILMALAIPRLGGFQAAARERTAESNREMVNNLLALHNAAFGHFPGIALTDDVHDFDSDAVGTFTDLLRRFDDVDYLTSEQVDDLDDFATA